MPLKSLLRDIGQGSTGDELLTTVAARLMRLRDKLTAEEQHELTETAGSEVREIAARLIDATDGEAIAEAARVALSEDRDPTDEQMAETKERLIERAVEPLLDNKVREKILGLQTQKDQIIDIASQDALLSARFVDAGEAGALIQAFEDWIKEHHDEYVALRAYFEQPADRRPSLDDIKALAQTIEAPPLNFQRRRLWEAYRKVAEDRVRGDGGRTLADIVSLVRFAVNEDDELVPYADLVEVALRSLDDRTAVRWTAIWPRAARLADDGPRPHRPVPDHRARRLRLRAFCPAGRAHGCEQCFRGRAPRRIGRTQRAFSGMSENGNPPPLPDGWQEIRAGDLLTFEYGKALPARLRKPGGVGVFASAGRVGDHNEPLVSDPVIVIGRKGAAGNVLVTEGPAWVIDTAYYARVPESHNIRFLAYRLQAQHLERLDKSTAIPSLSRNDLKRVPVRFPPRAEQDLIVELVDKRLERIGQSQEELRARA